MKCTLYSFFIFGFLINIFNLFKYYFNNRNINKFQKLIVALKKELIHNKHSEKINEYYCEVLKLYETYINSNINLSYYPDWILNQNIVVTPHWVANFTKYTRKTSYLEKSEYYSFDKLLELIDLTINECHISYGKNRYAIIKTFVNFIPIFYFRNCFDFFVQQFSIFDKEIPKEKNWWITLIEVTTVIANMIGIISTVSGFYKLNI